VVLIALGVIALLVETGKLNAYHLWEWYIRWWPLLLAGRPSRQRGPPLSWRPGGSDHLPGHPGLRY
jgi:hypothetical protein